MLKPETRIGKYLTVADICHSATALRKGIDNMLPEELLPNITAWVENIYDPLCDVFNIRIPFSDIYRCLLLNDAVGGSHTSQHMKAEAGDLDTDGLAKLGINNTILFNNIMKLMVFDQLIWEFGTDFSPAWVHVSYSLHNNRQQVLRSYHQDNKTIYKPFELITA